MAVTSPIVWLLFLALVLVMAMVWAKWSGRRKMADSAESVRAKPSRLVPSDADDDMPYVDAPQNHPVRPVPLASTLPLQLELD